jgi:hypothetical protein
VDNSSLLPVTVGTPALDSVFLAKAGSGLWLISRRPAGLYVRVANNGVAADWTYLGAFPEVNADGNWELYNSTDPTKELKFDLSGLPTGTTRTVTGPAGNGQMMVSGQAGSFTTLAANNGTLTASAPVLDLSQTWNASGTTFTGLNLAVTNTASANTSAFVGISIDGTQMFAVRRGEVNLSAPVIACGGGGFTWLARTRTAAGVGVNFSGVVGIGSNLQFGTGATTGGGDVILLRDSANTLAQYNGTNPQAYNIYNTFTSSTNHERGFLRWSSNVFQIGTEKGSGGGTARALEFQTDGVTRMTIAADGSSVTFNPQVTFGQNVSVTAGRVFGANQINLNATSTALLALGTDSTIRWGTSSSAVTPMLKRSSTSLQVRLADDSAFGDFSCGVASATGLRHPTSTTDSILIGGTAGFNAVNLAVSSSAVRLSATLPLTWGPATNHLDPADLVLVRDAANTLGQRNAGNAQTFRIYNTSTSSNANFERANFRWASNEFIIDTEAGGTGTLRGLKIGSATSSLLGFYGATPVDRPATVADPAGGGTIDAEARTAINDIIDRLQELGLIA